MTVPTATRATVGVLAQTSRGVVPLQQTVIVVGSTTATLPVGAVATGAVGGMNLAMMAAGNPGGPQSGGTQGPSPASGGVDPMSLNIAGSTQIELFDGTIQAMRAQLRSNAAAFWKNALSQDGPIEIWEINGQRYLYNGNNRWHAALEEGVTIPADSIRIIDKTGSQIPTWPLDQMVRLPGTK